MQLKLFTVMASVASILAQEQVDALKLNKEDAMNSEVSPMLA